MKKTSRVLFAACALFAVACPVAAAAGFNDVPELDDRVVLHLGAHFAEFKTDAAVGAGDVIGTMLRLEDLLEMESEQTVVRFDGHYRFNSRHGLDVGFWTLDREGLAEVDEEIEFDGTTYALGAEIASTFDVSWFRLGWRYTMLKTERGEAGVSAGLSVYDFSASLDGQAVVSDGMGGSTFEQARAEEDVLAPAPTVGMFVSYAMTPRLLFRARADLLNVEFGDLEARLLDMSLMVDWYFTRRVGVSVGAASTELGFKDTGDDPYSVDYRHSGFIVALSVALGDAPRR